MAEDPQQREGDATAIDNAQEEFADIVGAKEDRKVRARQAGQRSVWFGFGMFGLIGWSVAVPAVACIALGVWIDTRWPSPYSWTLMLLFVGVVLGCLNAWYWLTRERDKLDI
jgi:ATP synthase protein I